MSTNIRCRTAEQLVALGIPAEMHTLENLRRFVPPFEGMDLPDLQALADVVVYLGRHRISVKDNLWKSLPWGTHACLFYRTDEELDEPFRRFFTDGLHGQEKCIWVVSKTYDMKRAQKTAQEILAEAGANADAFELIRHADWYETPAGRFRSKNEILMGWLNKIEGALSSGFKGLRVAGDAHFHPDDLESFFDYEDTVDRSAGTLKIKALCTYLIPRFAVDQLEKILKTHQKAYGDFALPGR